MEIKRRTHGDFLEEMLANLNNTEDKTPNSFAYDILSSVAIVDDYFEGLFHYAISLFDIDNLVGEDLDKRVLQITGLKRKQATFATGEVVVEGEDGTVIPVGTIFLAGDTSFESLETVTISEGHATVKVESTVAGIEGDVVANSIDKVKGSIPGVTDVYNPESFTNGYMTESDDDLRERYYEFLQNPPKAGNPAHYKLWATEVDGIWDAKVFRTWDGPSTVKVVVVGLDRKTVDEEMLERVRENIMKEAPIAYQNLTVKSATGKAININVDIIFENGYEKSEVIKAIKSNINDYFNQIAFRQEFVSFAKIGGHILKTEGVKDYENLTLNGTTENIPLGEEEIPELGEMVIT